MLWFIPLLLVYMLFLNRLQDRQSTSVLLLTHTFLELHSAKSSLDAVCHAFRYLSLRHNVSLLMYPVWKSILSFVFSLYSKSIIRLTCIPVRWFDLAWGYLNRLSIFIINDYRYQIISGSLEPRHCRHLPLLDMAADEATLDKKGYK